MKDYLMIFRNQQMEGNAKPSDEQMNAIMLQWQNWIGSFVKQGRYSGTNRLTYDGKMVKSNKTVTDGPYVEGKEMIGGYLIIKANSLDEATELAKGCPGLLIGGTVEIRSVMPIEYDTKSANFLAEIVTA